MKRSRLFLVRLISSLLVVGSTPHKSLATLSIDTTQDTIHQLRAAGLIDNQQPVRLHLGCGQSYLQGYINIDFPATEHTVQAYSIADAHADISRLKCEPNSIDVIESHHIFEHFDRQTALALLCAWHTWLKPGGLLVIETPDFQASIRVMLNARIPYKQQQVTLRHIFGSHEAHWAYHYDGWYKAKFHHVLGSLGFVGIKSKLLAHNMLIPSILAHAHKKTPVALDTLKNVSKTILRDSMVDEGDTSMWSVWCQAFDKAMVKLHL